MTFVHIGVQPKPKNKKPHPVQTDLDWIGFDFLSWFRFGSDEMCSGLVWIVMSRLYQSSSKPIVRRDQPVGVSLRPFVFSNWNGSGKIILSYLRFNDRLQMRRSSIGMDWIRKFHFGWIVLDSQVHFVQDWIRFQPNYNRFGSPIIQANAYRI